jgi:hypothetical protein
MHKWVGQLGTSDVPLILSSQWLVTHFGRKELVYPQSPD